MKIFLHDSSIILDPVTGWEYVTKMNWTQQDWDYDGLWMFSSRSLKR